MSGSVIVLESDRDLRADLVQLLRTAGYDAQPARDDAEALACADATRADALLAEIRDRRDLGRIDLLHRSLPGVAVLAMGPHPSVELAIDAMKRGACDFLRKPFSVRSLEAALAAAGSAASGEAGSPPPWCTEDPGMARLLEEARAAAVTDATVQIVGESGAGKDRLARWIHNHSGRRSRPRVVVPCAAIPEELIDSELFGHEAGAFTGAESAREGQVRAAHGGTLVLDEIADASPGVQRKLLRVLQESEVLPVGGWAPVPVDVRWIATTQRDLASEVVRGRVREDLYYRLDVIVLRVPPLRERLADVPGLARGFLEQDARAAGLAPPELSEDAALRLSEHPFRGNVRELQNLMRRATVLYPGRPVDVERLLGGAPAEAVTRDWPVGTLNLREIERAAIVRSLAEESGNRTRASRRLGISVRTLRNKIHAYQLA